MLRFIFSALTKKDLDMFQFSARAVTIFFVETSFNSFEIAGDILITFNFELIKIRQTLKKKQRTDSI